MTGVVALNAFSFFNDQVLKQTFMVGNYMPPSIFGLLIIFVLLFNPFLRRFAFSGRELAVAVAILLAASCIPSGLMRHFTQAVVLPHHSNRINPTWISEGILDEAPSRMLVDADKDPDRVVDGFIQGLGVGATNVAIDEIPWSAWVRPLLFWLPLTLTLWIAMLGLILAVHPQWSRHELLPYPIAMFASAIFPSASGGQSSVIRNRLFLLGMSLIFLVYANNLAHAWFPDVFIPVQTTLNFMPLRELFPLLIRGGGSGVFNIRLYFVIIGIAFLVPDDVSLSFGIGPVLWYLINGILIGYGVNLGTRVGVSYLALRPEAFALFGASVGIVLVSIYTGRHYYSLLARRSLGLASTAGDPLERGAVWGFRLFLVLMLLFIFQLVLVGVDPVLAFIYSLFLVVGFLVLSRITAETGMIYAKTYFWPCALLWGIVGTRAMGPHQALFLMMVTVVIFIDPRDAITPFLSNAFKMLENTRAAIGRVAGVSIGGIILGLLVAVPVTIYIKYNMGDGATSDWWASGVSSNPFDNAVFIRRNLESMGVVTEMEPQSFIGRLGYMSPELLCVVVMLLALLLVLLFTFLRYRFSRWPLHPIMFVTWASTPLRMMGGSYLIGWLIKKAVSKYGGNNAYNRLKPLMFGLIAGELLGALLPSLVGTIYFMMTGDRPPDFRVLPG